LKRGWWLRRNKYKNKIKEKINEIVANRIKKVLTYLKAIKENNLEVKNLIAIVAI
jgi:hypothetical protein